MISSTHRADTERYRCLRDDLCTLMGELVVERDVDAMRRIQAVLRADYVSWQEIAGRKPCETV